MRKVITLFLVAITIYSFGQSESEQDIQKYCSITREHIYKDYKGMYREAKGNLKYPFISPGSDAYSTQLWVWDSWLSNIALRQILLETGNDKDKKEAMKYEQGCILNFLSSCTWDGYMPIVISTEGKWERPSDIYNQNMHKPVLAQHAAFLTKLNNGDAEWLREKFYDFQRFINNYRNYFKNKPTGLFYWQTDYAIGGDNDPCTFFRPPKSSGAIYLNCLMYKEFLAMAYLAKQLNQESLATEYLQDAETLKAAIQKNCWDERDGFYYSVDLNLLPITNKPMEGGDFILHCNAPRDWDCLIQRIEVWSGFMPLWAGIADKDQAKRVVEEHYKIKKTFNADYGIRTLSKMEKMYSVKATGNPSCWLGPVWGVSNYMVWHGLVKYGYIEEARELAQKTILLFGKDFEKNGALHEYYEPESGVPLLNKGFQNWNYLVLNMIAWYEGKEFIEEF